LVPRLTICPRFDHCRKLIAARDIAVALVPCPDDGAAAGGATPGTSSLPQPVRVHYLASLLEWLQTTLMSQKTAHGDHAGVSRCWPRSLPAHVLPPLPTTLRCMFAHSRQGQQCVGYCKHNNNHVYYAFTYLDATGDEILGAWQLLAQVLAAGGPLLQGTVVAPGLAAAAAATLSNHSTAQATAPHVLDALSILWLHESAGPSAASVGSSFPHGGCQNGDKGDSSSSSNNSSFCFRPSLEQLSVLAEACMQALLQHRQREHHQHEVGGSFAKATRSSDADAAAQADVLDQLVVLTLYRLRCTMVGHPNGKKVYSLLLGPLFSPLLATGYPCAPQYPYTLPVSLHTVSSGRASAQAACDLLYDSLFSEQQLPGLCECVAGAAAAVLDALAATAAPTEGGVLHRSPDGAADTESTGVAAAPAAAVDKTSTAAVQSVDARVKALTPPSLPVLLNRHHQGLLLLRLRDLVNDALSFTVPMRPDANACEVASVGGLLTSNGCNGGASTAAAAAAAAGDKLRAGAKRGRGLSAAAKGIGAAGSLGDISSSRSSRSSAASVFLALPDLLIAFSLAARRHLRCLEEGAQ
jgi:hypothetical protein